MELHVSDSLENVPPAQWNRLLPEDNPFLRHEFLVALERHGAVSRENGWAPQHLLVYDDDRLMAAAPAYLKAHSWGEFVFDFAWADAYARHGRDYYPKLIGAVPYTPATGPRLLAGPAPSDDRLHRILADGARAVTERLGASSFHWLFPELGDVRILADAGYAIRHGCQYHWTNRGYDSFDAFLGDLTSKKRKNIRRERRLVTDAGIEFRIIHGDEADGAVWADLHRFYRRTFRMRGNPPVLTQAFFEEIGRTMGRHVVLVVALRDGRAIAGAICLRGNDTLYGRYWGCDEEHDALHFETCYYQGIQYCIENGLKRFEPGAQGEHKVARGFLPTITYSGHHLVEQPFRDAVEDFLERERRAVDEYAEALTMEGPFRAEALQALLES
ncbi:MAG: GNAT family N-acetyltransferase [Ectothiorhodospiraceae bacterium]|jgi:hypothetical protein